MEQEQISELQWKDSASVTCTDSNRQAFLHGGSKGQMIRFHSNNEYRKFKVILQKYGPEVEPFSDIKLDIRVRQDS